MNWTATVHYFGVHGSRRNLETFLSPLSPSGSESFRRHGNVRRPRSDTSGLRRPRRCVATAATVGRGARPKSLQGPSPLPTAPRPTKRLEAVGVVLRAPALGRRPARPGRGDDGGNDPREGVVGRVGRREGRPGPAQVHATRGRPLHPERPFGPGGSLWDFYGSGVWGTKRSGAHECHVPRTPMEGPKPNP